MIIIIHGSATGVMPLMRASFLITTVLLLCCHEVLVVSVAATEQSGSDGTMTTLRPTIHTFFERIDDNERFTGMRDEDDNALLELWNETWTAAGWNTRILTLADAMQAPQYDEFNVLLQNLQLDTFSRLLLERWMAMAAVGGGWMADYDVFPLRPFGNELKPVRDMIIYDTVSPTLANGNATEWRRFAMALVENAQGHCQAAQQQQRKTQQQQQQVFNFWTDTLGLIHLIRNTSHAGPAAAKLVLPGHLAVDEPNVTSASCHHRHTRAALVVHFGPTAMQRGRYIPPTLRLPQYRAKVARDFLTQWYQACNIKFP